MGQSWANLGFATGPEGGERLACAGYLVGESVAVDGSATPRSLAGR